MGLLHVALGTVFLALKPYKKNWMNHVDGLLLVLLGTSMIIRLLEEKVTFMAGIVTATVVVASVSVYIIYLCAKRLFSR